MNIMFCGDSNVKDGIGMSVISLCRNCILPINVHVLTASIGRHKAIPDAFIQQLCQTVREYNPESRVIKHDLSDAFSSYLPTANMGTRFTPLCMLRLFADTVADIPDRILYLDTDVLCTGDFSSFCGMDMKGAEIAGVPDRYGKWFFGNVFRHDYLNSGVLLLDMAKIRQSGLFEKCRRLCRDKKMFMPDQSALNSLAVKIKVEARFNEQKKEKTDTVFRHFTTFFVFFPRFRAVTVKPWNIDDVHRILGTHEFDSIYDEYIRRFENEQRDTHILHN